MKTSLNLLIAISVITMFFSCAKDELVTPQSDNNAPANNLTASNRTMARCGWVLKPSQPGDELPRKSCETAGRSCRCGNSFPMVQYEKTTFYPLHSVAELLNVNINNNAAYMEYLKSIGQNL